MLIFTFKIVLFTNLVLFMANSFNKLHASFFHFNVNIKIILVMKTHMGVKALLKWIHICSIFTPDLVSQHDLCLQILSLDDAIQFLLYDITNA